MKKKEVLEMIVDEPTPEEREAEFERKLELTHEMMARFPGRCEVCGKEFATGRFEFYHPTEFRPDWPWVFFGHNETCRKGAWAKVREHRQKAKDEGTA